MAHSYKMQGLCPLYVRAELFTDHVISAIRAGEMSKFRQAYRKADILLIDDIQVFSRKGATQEEFFHTFNTLHLENKQIILAANCHPQELQLIEPRLVSRFEWGIVLPIKTLDEAERKQMLIAKSETLQFPLSEKAVDFLCETFASSPKALIKSLEGLALRLHRDELASSANLSLTAVKTLIADLIAEEQKLALTPTKIVQTVAEHYGITIEDVLGKSQTKECALPRQIAMHLCREKLKIPYIKIGDFFSRDHSTVITSVKSVQKSIDEENQEIVWAWQTILKKLY
jgi:chromosomal replication initiator protein